MITGQRLGPVRVAIGGISALVLTVGLARFLYTPLLPVMLNQTWLGDVAGGWLATVNYAGYMAGALLASSVADPALKNRLYRTGLIIAVIGTFCMGLTQSMAVWVILRFIAGLSGAAGLLIASGFVLGWLMRHGRRPELGLHFAGIGTGIAVSGLAAIAMAHVLDWAGQWRAAGVLALMLLIPAWIWVPAPEGTAMTRRSDGGATATPGRLWMAIFIVTYFCAGVGFVVNATFTVVITARIPALHGDGNLVWVIVGLAAMPAAFLWDRIARRAGEIPATIAAFAVQTAGIVLSAFAATLPLAIASALLYGVSFIGIVSLTLALVGRLYPRDPSGAMARLTLSYGAAQIIAPAVSGYIAALTGSYRGALAMAAAVMVAGMVGLGFLRRPGIA